MKYNQEVVEEMETMGPPEELCSNCGAEILPEEGRVRSVQEEGEITICESCSEIGHCAS